MDGFVGFIIVVIVIWFIARAMRAGRRNAPPQPGGPVVGWQAPGAENASGWSAGAASPVHPAATDPGLLARVTELEGRLDQALRRIAELEAGGERATDRSAAAVPVPAASTATPAGGSPVIAEVRRLLAEGRKIEAIKVYRDATGVGLAEAKDVVEAFEGGLDA